MERRLFPVRCWSLLMSSPAVKGFSVCWSISYSLPATRSSSGPLHHRRLASSSSSLLFQKRDLSQKAKPKKEGAIGNRSTSNEEDDDEDDDAMPGNWGKAERGPKIVTRLELHDLERVRPDLPEVLEYNLHTMSSINDTIVNTYKKHRKMKKYVSSSSFKKLGDLVEEAENKLQSESLGMCFYIRVIDITDTKPAVLTKCACMPFTPFKRSLGPAAEIEKHPRVQGEGTFKPYFLYRPPSPTPTRTTAAQRETTRMLRQVLQTHFSSTVLEPIEGELTCDCSLYARYRTLCENAAINVKQMRSDLKNIIAQKYIRDFENYGVTRAPSNSVTPLSSETVALHMAAFFKASLRCVDSTQSKMNSQKLKIIIGIGRTAVQAKIACDIEVAAVFTREKKANAQLKGALKAHQLVRVRSFYAQLSSIKHEKSFVSSLHVYQIPTVNTAFALFLKSVFGVERVGDILSNIEDLHFSLCKSTFDYCVRLAFCRMQFPHEIYSPLLDSSAVHSEDKLLTECAANAISLLNPSRTKLRATSVRRAFPSRSCIQYVQSKKGYGRLISNEKFVHVAEEASYAAISMMHFHHCSTAALALEDLRGTHCVASEEVSFPRTTNPQTILRVVLQVAEKLSSKRRSNIVEESSDSLVLCVTLKMLETSRLLPKMLEEGITAVAESYKEALAYKKKNAGTIKWLEASKTLYRPVDKRGNRMGVARVAKRRGRPPTRRTEKRGGRSPA